MGEAAVPADATTMDAGPRGVRRRHGDGSSFVPNDEPTTCCDILSLSTPSRCVDATAVEPRSRTRARREVGFRRNAGADAEVAGVASVAAL